jgi:hypothetical protein
MGNMVDASEDETTTVISPSILSVKPYSYGDYVYGNDGTYQYDKLKIEVGNIKIDTDNIISMSNPTYVDEDGNTTIGYWYRIPLLFSINVYTVLDKYDAIPIGTSAYQTSETIQWGGYRTRANWACEYSDWTYWEVGIPNYHITRDDNTYNGVKTGQALDQVSDAKTYFSNRYTYNSGFMLSATLNPSFGMPSSITIEDGNVTLDATYSAVRMVMATTLNDDEDNLVTGLINDDSEIYITTTGEDVSEDISGNYDATEEDVVSIVGDADMDQDVLFDVKGLKTTSTYMTNEAYDIKPVTAGRPLDIYDADSGKSIEVDSYTPSMNITSYYISYPVSEIKPELDIYETNYVFTHYYASVDDYDEWAFFGDAGVRESYVKDVSYTAISCWKVKNVFIHQDVGAYIDIFCKYNVNVAQGSLNTEELSTPTEDIGDEYIVQLLEGILSAETTTDTNSFSFDSLLDNIWSIIYIAIALIAIVVVVKFVILKPRSVKSYIPQYQQIYKEPRRSIFDKSNKNNNNIDVNSLLEKIESQQQEIERMKKQNNS